MAKNPTDVTRAKNLGLFSGKEYKTLQEQVNDEIATSRSYCEEGWEIDRNRVKLYNNRGRSATAIGDPLVFTQFQSFVAAMYDDKLKVEFIPNAKDGVLVAENLNPLYERDAIEMNKPVLDFGWLWNTCFFGRALMIVHQWNGELLIPQPELVNMLTWHRDPNATSMNGDSNGKGGSRFGGRPISLTWNDLQNGQYVNIDEIKDSPETNQEQVDADQAIKEAHGFEPINDVTTANKLYSFMEWYTWFEMKKKGGETVRKRVLVTMDNSGLIVRFMVLKDQEAWGILEKTVYPDPLSWEGVSIVDILEDKQRARARIINASLFNVESNVHQMYAYDSQKIKDGSFLNFGFNKHIPVNGSPDNVIRPIERKQIGQEVDYMLNWIQDVAQRATGITEIQQGAITGAKRTATEIATVSEGADTRFSLSAKIFGWSEASFARYWHKMYKMYFSEAVNEKTLRLNGMLGYTWKPLKKSDIVGKTDPEIKVESKIVGEARRLRELQNFTNSYNILAVDPSTNKEFLSRKLAKLNGYSTSDMGMLFNPNPDRIVAQEENKELDKGEDVKISGNDNDIMHIDEHQKLDVTKPAVKAHIDRHMKQIVGKAKNMKVQGEVEQLKQQQEPMTEQVDNVDFSTPKTLQTA